MFDHAMLTQVKWSFKMHMHKEICSVFLNKCNKLSGYGWVKKKTINTVHHRIISCKCGSYLLEDTFCSQK